jgi:hypothetical protein
MNINDFLQVFYTRVKFYSIVPVKLLLIGTALLLFAFAPRNTDPLVRIVAVLQKVDRHHSAGKSVFTN